MSPRDGPYIFTLASDSIFVWRYGNGAFLYIR
jgi:hypothetical protein